RSKKGVANMFRAAPSQTRTAPCCVATRRRVLPSFGSTKATGVFIPDGNCSGAIKVETVAGPGGVQVREQLVDRQFVAACTSDAMRVPRRNNMPITANRQQRTSRIRKTRL